MGAVLIACVVAAGVGGGLIATLGGSRTSATAPNGGQPAARSPVLVAGTAAAFRRLATQRSNRCSLKPGELESYPPTQRLQGSCCEAMDHSTYEWQVKALRRYAFLAPIPRDPYDVPVSLARQLLHYDSSIHLTRAQGRTYDHAMQMSREHGPCCCRCWRWNAFRGMSTYLIAHAHWTAPKVALIIDDVEGCGGKDEPPRTPSLATA